VSGAARSAARLATACLVAVHSLRSPVAAQAPGAPPVFASGVEAVYVDAFVVRGGRPVLGLRASNFELKDNGRRQQLELVSVEALPLTALLVFDTSDSVRGAKLQALRAAGQAFLAGTRQRDAVGLMAFSEEIRWLARPTSDHATLGRAIDALRAQGATAVWDALFTAISVLPTASRSVVVVFSDGEDNLSWLDGAQVRTHAERSNALVQVVVRSTGEPEAVDPVAGLPGRGFARSRETLEPAYLRELRQVAETTGGRVWRTDSPAGITAAFAAIVEAMNTRYVLRYDPGPGSRPGWHRIELRLRGTGGDVHARRGYWRGR
jgi:VWFA-related protein